MNKRLFLLWIGLNLGTTTVLKAQVTPSADVKRSLEYSVNNIEIIKGNYGIWYKNTNCNNGSQINRLTNPFIIVEGFDPFNSLNLIDIYDQINTIKGAPRSQRLLYNLQQDGFDIVVLNLNDNNKEIEKNAKLLEKLIEEINNEVQYNHNVFGTPIHRPYALGISMGSLIVRYCLTQMERDGKDHKTEFYISFDGPQKGVNVPLGIQHLIDQVFTPQVAMAEFRAQFPSALKKLDVLSILEEQWDKDWLTQPAALQMVMSYIRPNPRRRAFADALSQHGYPQRVWRNIGIANGTSGKKQEDIDRGGKLMEWNNIGLCLIDTRFSLPYNLGYYDFKYCPITNNIDVYAMPGALPSFNPQVIPTTISSLDLSIQPVPFSPSISFTNRRFAIMADIFNRPVDPLTDHVPGGNYGLGGVGLQKVANVVNTSLFSIPVDIEGPTVGANFPVLKTCYKRILGREVPYPCFDSEYRSFQIFSIHESIDFFRPFGRLNLDKKFCFVPTVSALDIRSDDWFYNVAGLGHYPKGNNTPFDFIYWTNTSNTFHGSMPAFNEGLNMAHFIKEEISPKNLFIQDRHFPLGYVNTFEAKGIIAIGNNVDPMPGRSSNGNVTFGNGVDITLVHGAGSYVYFDDGFDATNFNGVIEVLENRNTCASDIKPVTTTVPNPDWNRLRVAQDHEVEEYTSSKASPLVGVYDNEKPYDGPVYKNELDLSDQSVDIDASPNPFKTNATINYTLPHKAAVTLVLYNGLGEKMFELVTDSEQEAGSYQYGFDGSLLPNGVYLYQLIYNQQTITKRLVLAR